MDEARLDLAATDVIVVGPELFTQPVSAYIAGDLRSVNGLRVLRP